MLRNGQTLLGFLQQDIEGVFIDMDEVRDCFDILHRRSEARIPICVMNCLLLSEMFEVEIPEWGKKLSDDMREVMAKDWLKALKEMYYWNLAVGVAPYKWIYVRGTNHWYPLVLNHKDGMIRIVPAKERGMYEYQWFWNRDIQQKPDEEIHFRRSADEPDPDGRLRSVLSSVLELYRTAKIAELQTIAAGREAAHPSWIFEQKNGNFDINNYNEALQQFGQAGAGFLLDQDQNLGASFHKRRRDDMREAFLDAHRHNFRRGAVARTSTVGETDAANADRFMERSVLLDPNWHLVNGPQSRMIRNPLELWKRLENDISSLMGFPLDFVKPSSRQASGKSVR